MGHRGIAWSMHGHRALARWVCVSVSATLLVLSGCGEPPQRSRPDTHGTLDRSGASADGGTADSGDLASEGQPAQVPDRIAPAETEPAPGDVRTVADLKSTFTMPSSFRMEVLEQGTVRKVAMQTDGRLITRLCAETHSEEMGHWITIANFDEKEMVSWQPETGRGTRQRLTSSDNTSPWDGYPLSAPVVGSDTIDGVECWRLDLSEQAGGVMWIGKEDGLMRREEAGGEITRFVVSDINSVPDSVFDVPDGLELQETRLDVQQLEGVDGDAPEGSHD